ncbi:MAG: hypothetical protein A2086_06220 [Spirochaetes bacterium GWD1_27_9]|nr:MAG: hypothetical protein A2Z98_16875 [Spirochaetes bacterium GWB1_27_13]OHD27850.1 MAG: hypothetical protein A2Y34_15615 [Spirochaetes bacterium GWC1_27_15]OHD30862.1 MAG: hypothetical protein A2086_06220 [Spirochaetes bacterium GWD1_27_9]
MCDNFLRFESKYKSQKQLIEELYLMALIDSFQRVKLIKDINTFIENKIRNKFVYDLENKNEFLKEWINSKIIFLTSENQIIRDDENKRTDIEFIVSKYGKFVVECKRLNSAEERYIKGKYDDKEKKYTEDGIERFTNSIYAKDEQFAGMIGFVVDGDINKIILKLKDKIKDFKFDTNSYNLLETKCADWETSFQSKHIRDNNKIQTIHLYHLFLNFPLK